MGQLNQANTLETQQNDIFTSYPDLANDHYNDYVAELKNPNASLKDGFEFFLHRKGLLPSSKTPEQLAEEERIDKINANSKLNGSLAGASSGSQNIQGKPKVVREAENFFNELLY